MDMATIRCTTAQAIVRYLSNQFTEVDSKRVPLFPGVYGIFGHGNVTCLGEALEAVQDVLPTWRGQNEQSMAFAAVGFAKAMVRRQIMVVTASIGPGTTNLLTAAGVAHTSRLPLLMICGDSFARRHPDPVMQQVEHFNDPTQTVNDAFKAVSRYWDRITYPEQILSSLPQAVATLLDPGDCGPAFIGVCQDVQEMAWDYPEDFFAPRLHLMPRPRPDRQLLARAAERLKQAKRPLIISGGGVRYSQAEAELAQFALAHGIPVVETIAGKGAFTHDDPIHCGPIGILGSTSANALAAEADVVIAVGTRLMDFVTGSWTVFDHKAQFIALNAARFDAHKHLAIPLECDAREGVSELHMALGSWKAADSWLEKGRRAFAKWNELIAARQERTVSDGDPTYAQVIGVVNAAAAAEDYIISAAGGLPGELVKGWRVKNPGTFDCEFGFSCMGYELSAGWGVAMAEQDRDVFVMIGDGTYMMMNSDIYSSVLSGHKFILLVCDNGGYAVINRLQNAKGGASFNNLLKDCRVQEPFHVDFVAHAQSMGALARKVSSLDELEEAIGWAKGNDRTTVISIDTHPFDWTPGDAWWDVGVPEVSARDSVNQAREEHVKGRLAQRVGI
ncbi:3D-(3,5/4)-trihydroxycyclohexane-1,2-dione acylhydrolase (decyclizing) [Pantoea sp. QMID2]|nr:3D-(3,5/4)-trihydroxycyclohexane-1,2-dione acylhydrolase (decyclizing) [Pantoea sp. QMID3]GME29497.1 3D-(3,5/4)-trihydroxycyclohexane-1,2-dione acylhydrolase (decyclizing) [Pantoea sp. QMID1]GME48960.1 3D-(3,5/4)-trihydroxycyclohexane-1,2-dione acylhydrolase (decyclizing) [Pantoea sp. QMID4]GME49899.1 3D-(3,5/4)-trihydroxycyclohexane-1,2-dione acylhydrolase (decyclizing) [Pantoea sp. QMID2]